MACACSTGWRRSPSRLKEPLDGALVLPLPPLQSCLFPPPPLLLLRFLLGSSAAAMLQSSCCCSSGPAEPRQCEEHHDASTAATLPAVSVRRRSMSSTETLSLLPRSAAPRASTLAPTRHAAAALAPRSRARSALRSARVHASWQLNTSHKPSLAMINSSSSSQRGTTDTCSNTDSNSSIGFCQHHDVGA